MDEPRQLTIDGDEEACGSPPVVVQPLHGEAEPLFDFPETIPGQLAIETAKGRAT